VQISKELYLFSIFSANKKAEEPEMLYLPAPGSPGPPAQEDKKESSDSEEDTLDAFMSNLVNEMLIINIEWEKNLFV
jgi:hypothetical protein